jgi:outer membrane protein assembly factor BamE
MGKSLFAGAIISIYAGAACLSACNSPVYKVDINQGNAIEDEALDKLELGMTQEQVRYVLGNPLIADSFHADRWDYVYYFKPGNSSKVKREHVIVYFEEGKVTRIQWSDPKRAKTADRQ